MSKAGESEIAKLQALVAAPVRYEVELTWFDVEQVEGETEPRPVLKREKHVLWVSEVKTGKIPQLLLSAGTLIQMLTDKRVEINAAALMMMHPNECLDVLSVLIDKPRSFVDRMDLDDTAKLLEVCMEANLSFFVPKVLPLLSGGLERLTVHAAEVAKRLTGKTQQPS